MALNITGVSEETFNDLFDGDEELFLSILHTFVDRTPSVLSKIGSVSNETLPDYANLIHGIRGSCANICAEEAKEAAMRLETMARKGDLSGVLAENGTFLSYMEKLMGNLKKWLENHKG